MFPERLKAVRLKHNLTLKALGAKIGMAESTVSLYESGKREPDLQTIHKLADYFNVTVDYLIGRTDIFISTFSEQLKNKRLSAGITQAELAKTLGISRSAVGMYESGEREPGFAMVANIAKALGIAPVLLMPWSNEGEGKVAKIESTLQLNAEDFLKSLDAVIHKVKELESRLEHVAQLQEQIIKTSNS